MAGRITAPPTTPIAPPTTAPVAAPTIPMILFLSLEDTNLNSFVFYDENPKSRVVLYGNQRLKKGKNVRRLKCIIERINSFWKLR